MAIFADLDHSIDVKLPTECDDEYWTTPEGESLFKQPLGKPSKVAAFNCYIRLTQIMTLAHRTIVGLFILVLSCNANVLSSVVCREHPLGPIAVRHKRARVEVTDRDRA